MDWQGIWDTIVNFFESNGWAILGFFLTLIAGIIIVKVVINITRRVLNKTKMEKIAQQFIVTTIKFVLYLVLILILLSIVGVQISGILTTISALLLAVGLALENNIANLANGIIVISTHMFKKGDYVSVDGVEGSIVDINFFFTTIMTSDNKKITLPNSEMINNPVVNSGASKTRRVDFTFSVAYETDVELVKKIVLDVMKSNGKVYLTAGNEPFCRLKTLGASSIDFAANCWCDNEDYWDVYYYVVENVYNEFKRNKISIPYNQLEVRSRTDEVVMPYNEAELPERVEKVRGEDDSIDLETASLSEIIRKNKHKKEVNKNKKKAKKKAKNVEKTPSAAAEDGDEGFTKEGK